MTVLTVQVSAGGDDGDQKFSNGAIVTTAATTLLEAASTNRAWWAGRILNVTVAPGVTISAMTLSLFVNGTTSMDATIWGNKVASPVTLGTTASYISSLAETTHSATWNATLTTGQFNASPDISAIGTELIGQGSWASGDPMLLILQALSASVSCTFDNYETAPSNAAEITFTYSSGGGNNQNLLTMGVG